MAFVKVLKNSAYCSRYQTKNRRRREGKTDYQARRRLVFQDKNKYDTKKYRFAVRRTNRRIICSIIFATLKGDRTMTSADSQELRRFGITAGLTSYSAAYATGLLCARRLLKEKKMDTMFVGQTKIDGALYSVKNENTERRAFQANLDVGLVRTTTGNRVFGAMKGANDGGIHVPHKEKRFPGYRVIRAEVQTNKRGKKLEEQEKAKTEYKPEVHKDHIMGKHVQDYYDQLKKGDANRFKRQFSQWTKCLEASKAKNMMELWQKAHAAIRANPDRVRAVRKNQPVREVVTQAPNLVFKNSKGQKWLRSRKTSHAAKKALVASKIKQIKAFFSQ